MGSGFSGGALFTFFVKGAGLGTVKARIDRKFTAHHIRVMKSKLRRITVALDEEIARWASVEAARKDTSVSRLLGAILKERMLHSDGYERAMRRALARKAFPKTEGRYLSREEVHDRAGLR